jgi:hypothetical protein
MIDSILAAAYRDTDYWVDHPRGRFAIRIGEPVPQIVAESWAFITACNPGSKPLTAKENAARMRKLEQIVRDLGLSFLRGEGVGRDGAWPPEPSLLILNIDEATAIDLARQSGQAAIVFGRRGEPARLVWIDDGDAAPDA